MEIKELNVDEVNPAPYNPRKDLAPEDKEYKKLERSIEEFGLVQLLVYNENTGNLVGGHQTLKILKDKNIEKAKMSVVNLPIEKEKQLNIALNKISGEWDKNKLATLLDELTEDINELEITGFNEEEVNDLVDELELEEEINYFEDLENEEVSDEQKQPESFTDVNKKRKPEFDSSLSDGLKDGAKSKLNLNMKERLRKTRKDSKGSEVQEIEERDYVKFSVTVTPDERSWVNGIIKKLKEQAELESSKDGFIQAFKLVEDMIATTEEDSE